MDRMIRINPHNNPDHPNIRVILFKGFLILRNQLINRWNLISLSMKTDKELKQTNPELYRVARENGTESRFSGKYVDEKSDGMYH